MRKRNLLLCIALCIAASMAMTLLLVGFTMTLLLCEKEPAVNVTGIELNHKTLTLTVGGTEKFEATIEPDDATNQDLNWESSAPDVAVVDAETGLVTAVAKGEATITATAKDSSAAKDVCEVTVKEKIATITMTTMDGEVMIGLAGEGEATIDWDDDTEPETIVLSEYRELRTCKYSTASTHNIVIKGQNITNLHCFGNHLTTIDVSGCAALTELDCSNNQLSTLDVSNNTSLMELDCDNNRLTTLSVSGCAALTKLYCTGNRLTNLYVSNNAALEEVYCRENQLPILNVSGCTALTSFQCSGNKLQTLDLSDNTSLTELFCNNNQLTTLDVSSNTALEKLDCFNNRLTTLDVGDNTALKMLWCDGNKLTALDVSNNFALKDDDNYWFALRCQNNLFDTAALNTMFGTLPGNDVKDTKTIFIKGNPGAAECDQTIAADRSWTVDTTTGINE